MQCVNNLIQTQNSHLKDFKPKLNTLRKDSIHPLFSTILTGCSSLSSIQSDLVRTVASSIVKEALLLSVEKLCRDQSDIFQKIEKIPLSPDRSKTFMSNEASNDELKGYANGIVEISLIGAGIALGLDSNTKSSVFGLDKSNKESVSNIKTKMIYDELVRKMSVESVLQAALSLGYCEIDIKNALIDESDNTCKKRRNLTVLAVDFAKKAVSEAVKSIQYCAEPDLMTNFEKREGLMQINSAISNLKSNTSHQNEASFASLAYNALRCAARSLGYSETEIKMIIGKEKNVILQRPKGIETNIDKMQHSPNTHVNQYSKFSTELKIMDILPKTVLIDKLETEPNKSKTKPAQVIDTVSCKNLSTLNKNSRSFGTDDKKKVSRKSLENILSSSLISDHDFLTDTTVHKTPQKLGAELTSVIASTPTSSFGKNELKDSSKKTTSVWDPARSSCSELNCNENNDFSSISNDSLFVTDEPEIVLKNPADFFDNKKSSFAVQKKQTHRYLNKRNLRRTVSHQLTSNVKQKCFRFYSSSHIQPSVPCDEYVWKRLVIADEPSENTYERSKIALNSKRSSNQEIKLELKSNSSQSLAKLSKITSFHKTSAKPHTQHLLYESNITKNFVRKAQSSSKLKREFLDESVYNSSYLKPVSVSVNTGLRRVTNIKSHNISLKDMLSKNQHAGLNAEKYSDPLNGPACVDTPKLDASKRNLETGPNNCAIEKVSRENIQQDNETLLQTNISRTSVNIPNKIKKQSASALNKVEPSGMKLTPSPPLVSKPHYFSQSVKTVVDNKNAKELPKCRSLDSARNFRNARVRPFSSNREATLNNRLNIVKHVNPNETGASIYPFINDIKRKRSSRSSLAEKSFPPQINSADENNKTLHTVLVQTTAQESFTPLKFRHITPAASISTVTSKDGRGSPMPISLASNEEPTDQMITAKISETFKDKTISKNLLSDEMALNPLGSHPDRNNPV